MDEITEEEIENVRKIYTKNELAYLFLKLQRDLIKSNRELFALQGVIITDGDE